MSLPNESCGPAMGVNSDADTSFRWPDDFMGHGAAKV